MDVVHVSSSCRYVYLCVSVDEILARFSLLEKKIVRRLKLGLILATLSEPNPPYFISKTALFV